jgi:hypothetical protein
MREIIFCAGLTLLCGAALLWLGLPECKAAYPGYYIGSIFIAGCR